MPQKQGAERRVERGEWRGGSKENLTKEIDEKCVYVCVKETEGERWWPTLHFCATSSPGHLRAPFST